MRSTAIDYKFQKELPAILKRCFSDSPKHIYYDALQYHAYNEIPCGNVIKWLAETNSIIYHTMRVPLFKKYFILLVKEI